MTCSLLSVLALFAVLGVALAVPAEFSPCINDPSTCTVSNASITPSTDHELCLVKTGNASSLTFDFLPSNPVTCTASNVRITPCTNHELCLVKKGHSSSLAVDFIPTFAASKLKARVHLTEVNGAKTTEYRELVPDGCEHTVCPTVANQSQKFDHSVYMNWMLPFGTYRLSWKLWDEENSNNMCCYETNIILI